jgi:hypothetical protein
MARDGKQLLRFSQQAYAAANGFAVNNYAMGATASSGALITSGSGTPGTAGIYFQGTTNALNRSGFRNTNADQTLIVSGETSAISGDPAIYGQTEMFEGYVRFQYAPAGALQTAATVSQEIFVQAASDSGSGTAGTDWTNISASLQLAPFTWQGSAYSAKSASVAMASGVLTYSAAHGFTNGQVIWITSTTPTGFALYQPLFVVNATTNSHGVSLVAGSTATNTALSTSAAPAVSFANNVTRIISLPLTPTAKPWVRLVYRALPVSGTTVAAAAGVWIDNVGLTVGRDAPALI